MSYHSYGYSGPGRGNEDARDGVHGSVTRECCADKNVIDQDSIADVAIYHACCATDDHGCVDLGNAHVRGCAIAYESGDVDAENDHASGYVTANHAISYLAIAYSGPWTSVGVGEIESDSTAPSPYLTLKTHNNGAPTHLG